MVGAISFSMLLMSFIAFDIVLLFPKERDFYTRESQAGLYGASAFFHARCLAELPGHLTAGGAYATIAYWMMGFQNSPMKFAPFSGRQQCVGRRYNSFTHLLRAVLLASGEERTTTTLRAVCSCVRRRGGVNSARAP